MDPIVHSRSGVRGPISPAMRLARKAWRLQFLDSSRSLALAIEAAARGAPEGDAQALGWAALTRGFHSMRFAGPREAEAELDAAVDHLSAAGDRRGELLALAGRARCLWLRGEAQEALDRVLLLRAEALEILRQEERGVFLNVIAGGYSSLGRSAEAFAYMYQALRESSPTRNRGFDVVLYCNLAHELLQLGDVHEALNYVRDGLLRARKLSNPRLYRVLLLNRIVCLTDLGRPEEAMDDVREAMRLAPEVSQHDASYEALAIAAIRAGEREFGRELVALAEAALGPDSLPDSRGEGLVARAELLRADGRPVEAARLLEGVVGSLGQSVSLRIRCMVYQLLTDLHQATGNPVRALATLRSWQDLHLERMNQASLARRQAASVQTELLRLTRQKEEIDSRRRATERARKELERANAELALRMGEVEALKAKLEEQAVRDALTGLFNRRYLSDILPTLVAQARRQGDPLAVVIVDLDRFKEVNDTLGHLEGDRLLAAFGDLLSGSLRKGDVACRFGGEEFCLLLPGTDATGASGKVDRLLKEWQFRESGTFSAGIVDSLGVPGSGEALLKAADDAVLEAKRAGRARVVVRGMAAPTGA